ncbi:MAG: hypothetical protein K9N10_04445 [Deltaproteobacteria bacterium]|nr:hypothetical protein [Deltaproteobacteria bacterium]
MKPIRLLCVLLFCIIILTGTSAFAAGPQPWMDAVDAALQRALSEVGATKGQGGLLLLTNASYGMVDGRSTEQFIDLGQKDVGCSIGSQNLVPIHGSILDPLWFSLYRKDANQINGEYRFISLFRDKCRPLSGPFPFFQWKPIRGRNRLC